MNSTSFRTEIKLTSGIPIGMHDAILTTGSCFADQFGQWLHDYKFQVLLNPFGTAYNPISIHQALIDAIDGALNETLFTEHDGIWHHFDYHSRWSDKDKSTLTKNIYECQQRVNEFLKKSQVIIITYGTAWVYELKTNQHAVSNCHKVPASQFKKRLLHTDEIVNSFDALHTMLKAINPAIRFLVTVSPVRHLKDTLTLNGVSKAVLRLASHQLSEKYPEVDYFPSYEIMMDDLRDYRFYERDQIHPTEEALDYISQKFSEQYFTAETRQFIQRWETIRQAINHRAYHPESAAHQLFLTDIIKRLEALNTTVDVSAEIEQIKKQLHSNA